MGFMDELKETLDEDFNYSRTENGAIGYKTTGKELMDMNFAVSSLRNASEKDIEDRFAKVYYENPLLACKWLFYASDVREGIGERRLFRICMNYLCKNHYEIAIPLLKLIPEYSRWDNLFYLFSPLDKTSEVIIDIIKEQLASDLKNMKENKPVSLCAKWMPSANTSSKKTRDLAKQFIHRLGMRETRYRKILSRLRGYLKVVERNMSANEWKKIDYSMVPSRANLIYNSAFLRNDEERRRAFLEALERDDKDIKINASVLFPHDIVHRYLAAERGYYNSGSSLSPIDVTLEQLWKALPDTVQGAGNVMVVADGSGSMRAIIGKNSSVTALDVANSLAIYFAEHSSGQFKDQYITFSNRPQLVDFSNAKTLRNKIEIALRYNEVDNTNIEATFNLILQTAINKNMKQEELPGTILIISDCEFDMQVNGRPDARLFKVIAEKFKQANYNIPRLVFWNVNSRTGSIPVTQKTGIPVALVSGFSPNIVKMVLSNQLDPYKALLEQLNSERYQPVEDAVKGKL